MKIDKHKFLNAVVHGYEIYGHCKQIYFNPDMQCGCAIGVAAKMLKVGPSAISSAMDKAEGGATSSLWGRIVAASDNAADKHHAIFAVKQALNDQWPEALVLEV